MSALQSIQHSVVSFEIVGQYTITVKFEDHSSQRINLKEALGGALLRALHDEDFFRRVYISEGIPTLTWPNGADFNPDHLYDWPEWKNRYAARARKWDTLRKGQPRSSVTPRH